MSKIDDLKKNIPSLYKLNATTYFKAFMEAIGTSLEASSTQIQNAKEQIYVVSAVAGFLDALGSNVGVERPGTDQFYLNDTQFRALIPLLSYHPKQIHETMSSILDVFFGASHPDVFIEEINPNEIVVQVPATVPVIRDQLEGTAHLHGQSGYITKIDNVAKEVELQLENERKYLDEFNAVGTASTQYNGYYGTEGNIVYGSPLRVERGSSSLSFDKTGAGDVRTGIFGVSSITYYPLDLTGKKYFSFDIYLSDLTDVDSVEFKLFSTVANRSTDSVPVADLVVGVNRIVVDISDMTTEAGTGVDLAAVTHSAFVVVFNNAADVLAEIKIDNYEVAETEAIFAVDWFQDKFLEQNANSFQIVTSTVGKSNVLLTFGASDNLSVLSKLDVGVITNEQYPSAYLTYPTGLNSTITFAEDIRKTLNEHARDELEHTNGLDNINFPLTSPEAIDLPTLIVLVIEMLDEYEDHNIDAQLGGGWAFHAATQAGNDLASVVAPTTAVQCLTRLNDIQAKHNSHEASAVSHGVGSTHTQAKGNAWYMTERRCALNVGISTGDLGSAVTVVDASNIQDAPGYLVFNFGNSGEETLVPYTERPSNTLIVLDPTYLFLKDHSVGATINQIGTPAHEPDDSGDDYAAFNVGTEEPRIIAQNLVLKIKAAGVVIRFIIKVVVASC